MKKITDFDFKNKKVLLRTDFNVPLDEKGNILNDFRIKAVLPTIRYLIEHEAQIIIISHLGRPEGRKEKYSLKPVVECLEKYLGMKIKLVDDFKYLKIGSGETAVLENIRFYKEEEENDLEFAKQLAQLGDIYINDAFAVCHREHASIVGIPEHLPSGIGLLIEKELEVLDKLIKNPFKPFVAVMGGKKVETKAKFIDKISEICDWVLVGGLLPLEIEKENIQFKYADKIILPVDWKKNNFDVGEETAQLFKEKIKKARTVFWNGPLGKFEEEEFSQSSREVAQAIIESRAFSVVGGGETIEFLAQIGLIDKFSYVSTGGGAMLNYIVDGQLVGLDVLK